MGQLPVAKMGPVGYVPQDEVLYFERDSVDDPWYMKLEDSLRQLSPDTAKQN